MFRYFKKHDEFEVRQEDGSMKAFRFLSFSTANPEKIVIEEIPSGTQQEVSTYWFNLQEIYIGGSHLQNYHIPITWSVAAIATVPATSLEEAMGDACDVSPLPEGSYVEDSIALSTDDAEYIAQNYNAPDDVPPAPYGPTCVCGCDNFYAHQQVYVDVIVDGDNNFLANAVSSNLEYSITEAGKPYGPYTCLKCGREYDDLNELSASEE